MSVDGYETQPRRVDTFAVLDLDRTLLDTPALINMLLLQLHDHGFTAEHIGTFKQFIESQTGKSLSLHDFFINEFTNGDALYSSIKQEVLELVQEGALKEDLLYEGSVRLLNSLDESDIPFSILTYGNAADQDFKLTLFRSLVDRDVAQLHATVTQEPNKGAWIAKEWVNEGEIYVPGFVYAHEPIVADRIVIVDDKPRNLVSNNPNVKGVLIDNDDMNGVSVNRLAASLEAGEILFEQAS